MVAFVGISSAHQAIADAASFSSHQEAGVLDPDKASAAVYSISLSAWRRCIATSTARRGKLSVCSKRDRASGKRYEDYDFPPKPKWMRWKTYNRVDEKAQAYEKASDVQAIVGNVETGGGTTKSKDLAHAEAITHAPEQEMRSPFEAKRKRAAMVR
jgi:hypothetical protein